MSEITDKQWNVIHIIEDNLHISFDGKTRKDAIGFIDQNMAESIVEAENRAYITRQRARERMESMSDYEYEQYLEDSFAGFDMYDFCLRS